MIIQHKFSLVHEIVIFGGAASLHIGLPVRLSARLFQLASGEVSLTILPLLGSIVECSITIQAQKISNVTLRPFSLAEQCHTQSFYLRCFKSDFDAVKSKFGLLIE